MEQRTQEWLDARKGRVTASNAGAILGCAPYRNRHQAMRAMVREALGAESEFTGNVATEWGTANEAGAIIDFEMDTGLIVTPAPFVTLDDWAGASPDGYVSDGGLIEVKCPFGIRLDNPPVFKPAIEQPHYMAQMQMQMHVTGKPHCHFYQWTMHDQSHEVVQYDADEAGRIMSALAQFYAEYLDELANNADEHLRPMRVTVDTPEAHKMVAELDELNEAIELAAQRKKGLIAAMVKMAGGADAFFAGRKLTLTKRQGAISYAKVVKEFLPGLDLEPYRGNATEYWGVK